MTWCKSDTKECIRLSDVILGLYKSSEMVLGHMQGCRMAMNRMKVSRLVSGHIKDRIMVWTIQREIGWFWILLKRRMVSHLI
jgi:hypothetical protein